MSPLLIPGDRLRWTIDKRRREHAKAAKPKDKKLTRAFIHFNVLFDSRTTEKIRLQSFRESLATALPSIDDLCKPKKNMESLRVATALCNRYWLLLTTEKNRLVRNTLLRLGTHMFFRSKHRDRVTSTDGKLSLLMKKFHSARERIKNLRRLLSYRYDTDDLAFDEFLPFVELCLEMVDDCGRRSYDRLSEEMAFFTLKSMSLVYDDIIDLIPWEWEARRSAELIMTSGYALTHIFEGIRTGGEELRKSMGTLIFRFLYVLNCDFHDDRNRITVVIRHFSQLQMAFRFLSFWFLQHFLVEPLEFAAVFATSPSLLRRLLEYNNKRKLLSNPERNEDFSFGLIVGSILKASLGSPSCLQKLLGYNFLSICTTYCGSDYEDTFRRILELHPERKERFRKWTSGGPQWRSLAQLGRSIPERNKIPGAWYVFECESEEDSDD